MKDMIAAVERVEVAVKELGAAYKQLLDEWETVKTGAYKVGEGSHFASSIASAIGTSGAHGAPKTLRRSLRAGVAYPATIWASPVRSRATRPAPMVMPPLGRLPGPVLAVEGRPSNL